MVSGVGVYILLARIESCSLCKIETYTQYLYLSNKLVKFFADFPHSIIVTGGGLYSGLFSYGKVVCLIRNDA